MQMCHSEVDSPFVNQSAPHESPRYQNDYCRRSFPFRDVLICTFHRTIVFNVDFECFKLALWPTLRQKFMNYWSFLTRLSSWSKLAILSWVARFFNFSHGKTPNLRFLVNIILQWNVYLFSKNGNAYCCWIVIDSPHVNAGNRKLQETSRRFYETLGNHMFFKYDKMS